jgi:hypothetical protein
MHTQSKIPSALIVLHNFTLDHDKTDLGCWPGNDDALDNLTGAHRNRDINFGCLATIMGTTSVEKCRAEDTRDCLAQAMFASYQAYIWDQNFYNELRPEPVD